jgi:hypothetical protein
MTGNRGRRDKLGRDQRLGGLQPERQGCQPRAEARQAIDETAHQRAGHDEGQGTPLPVK